MQQPIKSALLSALIFPGLGQISAGYKKRGWFIILINGVLFFLMISEIVQQAHNVINTMQKSGIALDVEKISNTTSELIGFSSNSYLNSLLIILILSWGYAIFDAYRIANKNSFYPLFIDTYQY